MKLTLKKYRELTQEAVVPASDLIVQKALKMLDTMVKNSERGSIESFAFDIVRQVDLGIGARELAALYKSKKDPTQKLSRSSKRKRNPLFRKYGFGEQADGQAHAGAPVGANIKSVDMTPTALGKPVDITDRRYRKDKPPVIKRKYKKYIVRDDQ